MIEDDVKVLLNAVASLQRKVEFQEKVIKDLLKFVSNNELLARSHYVYEDDDGITAAECNMPIEFYLDEIKDKTYRTYGEYYEERYGKKYEE